MQHKINRIECQIKQVEVIVITYRKYIHLTLTRPVTRSHLPSSQPAFSPDAIAAASSIDHDRSFVFTLRFLAFACIAAVG